MPQISLAPNDPLPAICIACGAPAGTWKESRFEIEKDVDMQPTHGGSPFDAIVGLIHIFLWLIAVYYRSSIKLRLPWCLAHQHYWLWRGILYRGSLLAGFILFFAILGFFNARGTALIWCIFVAMLCSVWCVAALMLYRSSIRPVKVTADSVTLERVSEQFCDETARQQRVS